MRIAEVNDVASVARELARGLKARGHEVGFIQPKLVGAKLPRGLKPAVAPARAAEWSRIAKRLKKHEYDVAHIHYAYLGLIGRLARIPYVVHCHGGDVRDLSNPALKPGIVAALSGAKHVFYSTPDLAEQLLPVRPDAEFLPNPVDLERFAPQPLETHPRDLYICCALAENKGVEQIYEACRLLAERRPSIRITAVAGGPMLEEFDALPNVLLLEHQPRWKLPGIIARHRVVLGQVHEGAIGMAELEAMACERPVVAAFTYDDAYAEGPPIAHAGTAGEVTDEVLRLLDDEVSWDETGRASRTWIATYHDLEHAAERVEAVLEAAAR